MQGDKIGASEKFIAVKPTAILNKFILKLSFFSLEGTIYSDFIQISLLSFTSRSAAVIVIIFSI